MADDAQILQVPLKPGGAKADDWAATRANDLTQLNSVLRQVQEQIFKLNGRTGDAAIRSGLSVAGAGAFGGGLTASSLSLGGAGVTPSNPSFAPLVEGALAPVAFDYAPLLGGVADLRAASPFTWTLGEHFIGGGLTAGDVGELGWSTSGSPLLSAVSGEASHPGIIQAFTNGSGLTALYLSNDLLQGDLSYMAWVVRLPTVFRTAVSLGFRDISTAAKGSLGAYFVYSFAAGTGTWQTVTNSATGTQTNTSDVAAVANAWVLLEIVFSAETVDFYANRTRLFRHTGASVDPATPGFITCVQEMSPSDTAVDLDRCVVSGRGTDQIWT